jgi:hypothetical protein
MWLCTRRVPGGARLFLSATGRQWPTRRRSFVDVLTRRMAAEAKILDEDAETGAKKHRYVRVGEDHLSLAFTYAWMASWDRYIRGPIFFIV